MLAQVGIECEDTLPDKAGTLQNQLHSTLVEQQGERMQECKKSADLRHRIDDEGLATLEKAISDLVCDAVQNELKIRRRGMRGGRSSSVAKVPKLLAKVRSEACRVLRQQPGLAVGLGESRSFKESSRERVSQEERRRSEMECVLPFPL